MENINIKIPAPITQALYTLNLLFQLNWCVSDLKSTKQYKEMVAYADSIGLVLDYDKDLEEFTVTEKEAEAVLKEGIVIEGHFGTWYVIDITTHKDEPVYLLEHEEYGDEAACLIVKADLTVVCEDVWNGFEDLEDLEETE